MLKKTLLLILAILAMIGCLYLIFNDPGAFLALVLESIVL